MKESAKQAALLLSEKAGDLKDSAALKAGQMGDAIKEGAARANEAIQDSTGNKTVETQPVSAQANP